jgi:serine protease Do
MYRLCRVLLITISFATLGESPVVAQQHVNPRPRTKASYLSGDEARTAALYEKVLPTVVTIFTSGQVPTPKGPERWKALGSGVLISPECHVLTAAHVVDGADSIRVKTSDGKLRPAELLFSEPGADIALIRLLTPEPDLAHARLGDSDELVIGQTAYVVGSPYGLENSLSVGHISGFRDFDRLYDGSIIAEFLQTDAAINSGNSGGPVFNSQGEVIGIASRILTASGGSQGLGLAVTINTARQLLALEDRTWTGIDAVFLDGPSISVLLNQDLEGALLIQRVAPGSPAEKAGLRGGTIPATIGGRDILLGGDLILEFGGQEACHSECLAESGRHTHEGAETIVVEYQRNGTRRTATIDVSASRKNYLAPAR